jgi:hypothetical protein
MRFKFVIGGAIVGLGAIAAAIAIVVNSIDLDDVRALITEQAQAATGRELRIDGGLRFVLSLRPALAASDVRFANASWGSRPEMMTLDKLVIQTELWPLLSGEIRVRRLRFVGADVLLETNEAGVGNWEFAEQVSSTGSMTAESGDSVSLPSFHKVEFVDSVFRFQDGVTAEQWQVDIATLTAATEASNQPVQVELEGALDGLAAKLGGSFTGADALSSGAELPFDLSGMIGETSVSVRGSLSQPLDHRSFNVEVAASGANLAEFGRLIREELPAWRNFEIGFKLGERDGVLAFDDVLARVGQSDAAGNLTLALDGDRPRLEGSLSANRIDLSDLDESREESDEPASDGWIFSDKPLPYRWQNKIDGALNLAAKELVKGEAVLRDVDVAATLEKGVLAFDRARAEVSGGSVELQARIDGGREIPRVALSGQARRVDAGTLLRMLDLSEILSGGSTDIDIDVSSQGKSLHEIMAGLSGTASWSQSGGRIDDTFAQILLADLSGLLRTGSTGGGLTCLAGRFSAKAGVVSTRGLVADSPAVSILGTGTVNLGRETIDMRFDPAARQTSLAALAVPVDVTGSLADPTVTPDPLGVAETAVGAVSTITGDVFDILGEVVGEGGSEGSGGACVLAMDAAAKPKPEKKKSTGEQIIEDTGDVIEDIGEGIGDLFD